MSGKLLLPIFIVPILSCATDQQAPTYHKTAVLALHDAQRDHHFNKDSIAFADQLSKDFISVNRGFIDTPSREENITRYNNYFSAVEFEKWDDLSEPVVRFSEDSSMAYTIVDKIVILTYPDTTGGLIRDTTHFAWTTVYKRTGEDWKIDCVTSTQR